MLNHWFSLVYIGFNLEYMFLYLYPYNLSTILSFIISAIQNNFQVRITSPLYLNVDWPRLQHLRYNFSSLHYLRLHLNYFSSSKCCKHFLYLSFKQSSFLLCNTHSNYFSPSTSNFSSCFSFSSINNVFWQ